MGHTSLLWIFLLYLYQIPGSSMETPLFVLKGLDVLLDVSETDFPNKFFIFQWSFNRSVPLVTFQPSGSPPITYEPSYTQRIKILKNYSVILKNLQKSDSGLYTARVVATPDKTLAEYNITVQDPVSPVQLKVESVISSSDSCNITVTCSTGDSHISGTIKCVSQNCDHVGEPSKVTNSGSVLKVYPSNVMTVICNHSNQVSWTQDVTKIQHFCTPDAESLPDGVSLCLVKTVVFSVGLIIMVSAVISVHIMEKVKKPK